MMMLMQAVDDGEKIMSRCHRVKNLRRIFQLLFLSITKLIAVANRLDWLRKIN